MKNGTQIKDNLTRVANANNQRTIYSLEANLFLLMYVVEYFATSFGVWDILISHAPAA